MVVNPYNGINILGGGAIMSKTESATAATQTHAHEFLGSTEISGPIAHNHRFAGVTSQAIKVPGGHVHEFLTNTDFFFNHLHEAGARTGLQIPVGGGRHVHFAEGVTTFNFGHSHEFRFATLIENPIENMDSDK